MGLEAGQKARNGQEVNCLHLTCPPLERRTSSPSHAVLPSSFIPESQGQTSKLEIAALASASGSLSLSLTMSSTSPPFPSAPPIPQGRMWVMNEDGTRDMEDGEEDELASPLTLLRRIFQRDSYALTAGFEVCRTEAYGGKEGGWAHGLTCTFFCVCKVPPGSLQPIACPNQVYLSPETYFVT